MAQSYDSSDGLPGRNLDKDLERLQVFACIGTLKQHREQRCHH